MKYLTLCVKPRGFLYPYSFKLQVCWPHYARRVTYLCMLPVWRHVLPACILSYSEYIRDIFLLTRDPG
ncbi:hypothetical protein AYY18_14065 [Morganella psychrotolerans]|uniref:Uncharacterized protein n=1 Tax=Morganella psychrotolerans TaxID=368603 RepID=A0A1B8HT96_9GAMM|nr:hypothetical protein AYY18_14065 [Morganella psychrotolerans]